MLTQAQRRQGLFALRSLRRDYGITLRDARQAVRELKADGILERGCNRDEAADLIMAHIMADNPQLADKVGLDWETLLELFMKLLPLILALFGL